MSQSICIIFSLSIWAYCCIATVIQRSDVTLQKFTTRKLVGHRLRPGDPGVKFNRSKIDENKKTFPQMERWSNAGVTTGIPFLYKLKFDDMLDGGDSADINRKINVLSKLGGVRVLLLRNGYYRINDTVYMKSHVYLVGESRGEVRCRIAMKNGSAFKFSEDVEDSGVYRLTIEGTWGKPKYKWNVGIDANSELPDNENTAVTFDGAKNCWLDGVNIFNSADHPIRCNARHITLRDLDVDGVFNKNRGAHGYFVILDSDNLITQCKVSHLRHFTLQEPSVEYNVVFDNDFEQEVSFHKHDGGNNLIAYNRITLPEDMPHGPPGPDYFAIMGPWSILHSKSERNNFLYKNDLLELNHGGEKDMKDSQVHAGPIFDTAHNEQHRKNFPVYKYTPLGGSLYPIILD